MKQLLITIAAVVLVGCGPSVPDISIHEAAGKGNIAAVKQHLATGTDVNARNDYGYTPLDVAMVQKKTEIADLLLGRGGKSGAADSIHVAALTGNIEAVKQHLAAGADVNWTDENGGTLLHYVAIRGHNEIAELLIAKGADVNAKGAGKKTPLHIAASYGTKEVAELLITKGANVNAVNDDGFTPLDGEIDVGHPEIYRLLRKHGGKTGAELETENW